MVDNFHSISRFIDDLCTFNDCDEFGKAFLELYPTELELKVKHNGSHATFLDLDFSIDKGKFIYKIFDKRDAFHIVTMPSVTRNTPYINFHSSTMSEFVKILVQHCCLKVQSCRLKKHW